MSGTSFKGTTFTVFQVGANWDGPLGPQANILQWDQFQSTTPRARMFGVDFESAEFPEDYQFAGVIMEGVSFKNAILNTTTDGLNAWGGYSGFVDVFAYTPPNPLEGYIPITFEGAQLANARFLLCDFIDVLFTDAILTSVEWGFSACPSGDLPATGGVQACCDELVGPAPQICTAP